MERDLGEDRNIVKDYFHRILGCDSHLSLGLAFWTYFHIGPLELFSGCKGRFLIGKTYPPINRTPQGSVLSLAEIAICARAAMYAASISVVIVVDPIFVCSHSQVLP
jgi:hypothetical protein